MRHRHTHPEPTGPTPHRRNQPAGASPAVTSTPTPPSPCLNDLGLADIHQGRHLGVRAHSWIGRAGNGYRFDYVHAGPGLLPHLTAAAYLHQPRLDGLAGHGDHSAAFDALVTVRRGAVFATPALL